jgi:hypothetical protein
MTRIYSMDTIISYFDIPNNISNKNNDMGEKKKKGFMGSLFK